LLLLRKAKEHGTDRGEVREARKMEGAVKVRESEECIDAEENSCTPKELVRQVTDRQGYTRSLRKSFVRVHAFFLPPDIIFVRLRKRERERSRSQRN